MKAELYASSYNICQQLKQRETIYRYLSPNHISELKLWDYIYVYTIGPYRNSIRKNHPRGATIKNNVSLTCMPIIYPTTGWFGIVKVPAFDLEDVAASDKYKLQNGLRIQLLQASY